MKKKLLSVFTLFLLLTTTNAQVFQWANQIEGPSSTGFSISSNGNDIYSTGYFIDTADFDPGSGTTNLITDGSQDIYIQKLDQNGNFIWAKRVGGSGSDVGRKINDYGTHVIISGTFSGIVDFDPGVGIETRVSNGNANIFILALDDNGDFLWVKTFGGGYKMTFGGQELDSANNIVVSGGFTDSMTIDIGSTPTTVYSNFDLDVFVLKMDLVSGNITWIKTMGGNGLTTGLDLVLKSNQNILITGMFRDIMDANPDTSASSGLYAPSVLNTFIVELNQHGDFVDAHSFYSTNDIVAYDIELDKNENIYLTGYLKDSADFDPKSGTLILKGNGIQDCFIVKLTPSKSLVWAHTFGETGLDQSLGLAVGSGGDVYTTGRFSGVVDFDPGIGTTYKYSLGNDIFILKLDSAGVFKSVNTFGLTKLDFGKGLELDNDGNLYVNGAFRDTLDFDPTSGTTNLKTTGFSSFLLHFYDANNVVVGMGELSNNQTLSLYPNPVKNELFINIEKGEISEVNIYDVSGKKILSAMNFNSNRIAVSHLQNGVYILQILSDKRVFNSRFIKQ